MNFLYYVFNLFPIRKNKILFYSMSKKYGCNPKYITEELLHQEKPYELVWFTSKKSDGFPDSVRTIHARLQLCYALATSSVIISNCRIGKFFAKGIKRRKNQIYIQTWHGFPLKRIENDGVNLSKKYLHNAKIDSKNITHLLSNSKWLTNTYRSCFFYDGKIIETGSPRNDIFFHQTQDIGKKVKKSLNIPQENKIILYAPTFRDDHDLSCYSLQYQKIYDALTEKFNTKFSFLIRMHPNLQKIEQLVPAEPFVVNAFSYPDIQELLASTDILITDYSSVMFDFMLSKRPAFIFATDTEKYQAERGFYFSMEELPFPLAFSNKQLLDNIKKFDNITYQDALDTFIKKFQIIENGTASKQCADIINAHIQFIEGKK